MSYSIDKQCKIIRKKMKKVAKLKKMFFEDEFLDGVRKGIMMQCLDEIDKYYNKKLRDVLLGENVYDFASSFDDNLSREIKKIKAKYQK